MIKIIRYEAKVHRIISKCFRYNQRQSSFKNIVDGRQVHIIILLKMNNLKICLSTMATSYIKTLKMKSQRGTLFTCKLLILLYWSMCDSVH